MQGPQTHRDYARERHSDLLRQARQGELAARMAAARIDERRSFLARLQHRHEVVRPTASI
jgi:hypothetical protein